MRCRSKQGEPCVAQAGKGSVSFCFDETNSNLLSAEESREVPLKALEMSKSMPANDEMRTAAPE